MSQVIKFTEMGAQLPDFFETERKLMQYTGVYPWNSNKIPTIKRIALLVSCIINTGISVASLLTMMFKLFGNFEDLSTLADTLAYCMTQFAMVVKLLLFLHSRQILLKIEDFLEDPLFSTHSKAQNINLRNSMENSQKVGNFFRMACVCACSVYNIFPFLDKGRLLQTEAWFPWNVEDNLTLCRIFEGVAVAVSAVINSSVDIMTCKFLSFCSNQLKIMKENILETAYTQDEMAVKAHLVHNIKLYYAVKRLFGMVTELFSLGIFIQLLTTMGVICFTLFQLLTASSILSLQSAYFSLYLSSMSCQISIYCLYGHDIMVESNSVSDACYLSNWTEASSRVKKIVLMMMGATQQSIIFKAAGMIPLSIETLTGIMKNAYSFFTLLRRIYEE